MITYHHIGGRNGTFPVPLKNASFSQEVHLVLYEGDTDCFEQIIQAEKGVFGQVTVHPYCIGEKSTMGVLNINFHPPTSSLYSFNEVFENYTRVSNPIYGEYRLGDACRLVKNVSLHLLSLSDALKQANISAIDFLSLDIQGAEYDVLIGSKELIKNRCLGIQLEIEFAKIYQNQKSFFDINQLMEEMEFELIELNNFGRYAPSTMPIGFRGLEKPLYGEAIYIKKIDHLLKEENVEKLYKWSLFALINKKMGLCLQGLKVLASIQKSGLKLSRYRYIILLQQIWEIYQAEETCCLPPLAELFSEEMLSAFYQGVPNNAAQFAKVNEDIRKYLQNKYAPFLEKVMQLEKPVDTKLECLLREHGLHDVAEILKENRIREATYFLRLIRFFRESQSAKCQL